MHPDERIAIHRETLDRLKAVLGWPSLDRLEKAGENAARLKREFGEVVRFEFLPFESESEEWQMLRGFANALEDPSFAQGVRGHLGQMGVARTPPKAEL